MDYQFFKIDIQDHIATVSFNRPEKANSLHLPAWNEMKTVFENMQEDPEVRVIILAGEGKNFCAGMDMATLMNTEALQIKCEGRKREMLRKFILGLQDTVTAIEKCRKPVLAAIHRACVGGGLDIITACDMRYSTEDAYFCIREVDLGLVADLGTLQRLPTILPPGVVAELAYTGRNLSSKEAAKVGLVNQVFEDKASMMETVREIAATIAGKSPLVIRGTKEALLYKRDHSVKDSLDQIATWNAAMLFSNDLQESFQAFITKKKPVFEG